jgi:hypothetical protein
LTFILGSGRIVTGDPCGVPGPAERSVPGGLGTRQY